MAQLVSPGVSVTVTNASMFIPASQTTVPLYFVATADHKLQPDGISAAAGTYESDIVRTVTSLTQSTQLYGVPSFLVDSNGNPQHGDARNEYGVFALNQFLGSGALAYVVRANINLNDNFTDILTMWNDAMDITTGAAATLETLITSYIDNYNASNGVIPGTPANTISILGAIVPNDTTAGRATIAFTGPTVIPSTPLGIVAGNYTFKVAVDGGTSTVYTVAASGVDTMTTMAALMSAQVAAVATVAAVGNAFVITSKTKGTLSSVAVVIPASSGTDLVTTINTSLGTADTNTPVGGSGTFYTPTGSTPVTYLSVALTGGTGSGALANITVVNGGVSAVVLVNGGTGYTAADVLSAVNTDIGGPGSGFSVIVSVVVSYKTTVTALELPGLVQTATQSVWLMASFQNLSSDFLNDHTGTNAFPIYSNGFNNPSTGYFLGIDGLIAAGTYRTVVGPPSEWTAAAAASLLTLAADEYKYTSQFQAKTSLGSNDAARRSNIVTALNAVINSNEDIRSETYEYNLILCPGYYETANSLLNLSIDIKEEAMVIADTPFTVTPDSVVSWAATVARQSSKDVAYYYPHGLSTNLDGNTVFCASSGVAMCTISYSDSVSDLWFAPAGTQRGLVTVATDVGYVSGTLGTATTFNAVALNQGQRDNLYTYFTNINPIVFFPNQGLIVFGQKTSAPVASAEDRINVERLIMYVRRSLRKNTMSFVFEPNDQLTRNNLKSVVDGFLGNLIVKRGLYDFATVCDSSNNPPDVIDANEMFIDVALKPVRAAEFIYIPIRIVATGASLTANL